ncbi:hypothetical protein [Oceanithermus sp.]|uniref:hypothetical protein n=1 Tax=Oceanithermus sp. TaxID=2268145 RepID=UPI0025D71352|nr:hypothetical protein [Oceanithermus sp.]
MKRFLKTGLGALGLAWLLAACLTQNPGTKVTVHLDDVTGQTALPLAVAAAVGDSEWKRVLPDADGAYAFYVPEGETRYAVAVRCGGTLPLGAFAFVTSYYLTTDLTTEPLLGCATLGTVGVLEGTADVSQIAVAQSLRVFGALNSDAVIAPSGSYNVYVAQRSDASAVLLAYDDTNQSPLQLAGGRVFQNLGAAGVIQKDLSLEPGDTIVGHTLDAFTVPSGWSGSYKAGFYGAGGALVPLGTLGVGNQAGDSFFSFGGGVEGDVFVVTADANDGAARSLGQLFLMGPDAVGDLQPNLAFDPFDDTYSVDPATFPTFSLDHPNHPEGYLLMVSWPYTFSQHLVSSDWLGNRTAFTVPDLTNLWGFEDIAPATGEEVDWFLVAFTPSVEMGRFTSSPHYFQDYLLPIPRIAGMKVDSAMVEGSFAAP